MIDTLLLCIKNLACHLIFRQVTKDTMESITKQSRNPHRLI
jgi:hypothetical protein